MKFLVILAACFIYAIINTFITPLILEQLISDVDPLTAGSRAGFLNILLIVALVLFVRACFTKIDTKKQQKETALEVARKEHMFKQERICNEILHQISDKNLSESEINQIISSANLDVNIENKLKASLNKFYETSDQSTQRIVFANKTSWKCIFCDTENSTNYMQCKKCGKYKKSQNTTAADSSSTSNKVCILPDQTTSTKEAVVPISWQPVDETNAITVGETNIKCTNCHCIQFKANKVCNRCGAKFVKIEQ